MQGRTYRTWQDELDHYAEIIIDNVTRNCKEVALLNRPVAKQAIVDQLRDMVEAFGGKLKDTD